MWVLQSALVTRVPFQALDVRSFRIRVNKATKVSEEAPDIDCIGLGFLVCLVLHNCGRCVARLLPRHLDHSLHQKQHYSRVFKCIDLCPTFPSLITFSSVLLDIEKMRFSNLVLLVGLYIRTSFGSVLEVIDYGGQCLIWSDDNHGCTGYSAPLGLLNGDDCSSM